VHDFLLRLRREAVVQGGFDSREIIYRESAQEDFGSRTTVKVRGFEF
jgi:hypothetical protein